jgi:hypothetical protein
MTTEKKVLRLFGHKPQPSLRTIAEKVGVSRERVRQILAANGLKSVLTPTGRPAASVVSEPTAPYIEAVGGQLTAEDLKLAASCVRSYAALRRQDVEGQKGTTVAEIAARDADVADELAATLDRLRTGRGRVRPGADHVCDRTGPSVPVAMDVATCSVCGVPQVFD